MRRKRAALLTLLLLAGLVAVPAVLIWRQVRQEQLKHVLIAAAKTDDAATVMSALEAGANPNAEDAGDNVISFQQALLQLWNQLIRRKPKITPDTDPVADRLPTALYYALKPRSNEYADFTRGGPMWIYPSPQAIAIAKALLRKGADPNVRRNEYETPLLVDAVECNDLELIKLMLAHKADINGCGDEGVTAIFLAERDDHLPLLDFFLAQGANVNVQDESGNTPLMCALEDGYYQAAITLLHHGVNVQLRDTHGRTVLNYLNGRPLNARLEPEQRAVLFRILKQAGAK